MSNAVMMPYAASASNREQVYMAIDKPRYETCSGTVDGFGFARACGPGLNDSAVYGNRSLMEATAVENIHVATLLASVAMDAVADVIPVQVAILLSRNGGKLSCGLGPSNHGAQMCQETETEIGEISTLPSFEAEPFFGTLSHTSFSVQCSCSCL